MSANQIASSQLLRDMWGMHFIAFEGVDASGKSTLINGLKKEFERRQIGFVVTREPGGSVLGDEIRQLLLRVKGDAPVPRAEALLYQAGRAQHVEKLIRPALSASKWVLSDRFSASSVAFQSAGRDLSEAEISWLNHFSTSGLLPELNVLIDLSIEESFRRLARRGEAQDRFEREAQDFHERVRTSYLKQAKEDPEHWLVLPGLDSPATLLSKLIDELKRRKWFT